GMFVDAIESLALFAGLIRRERSSLYGRDGVQHYPIWERQKAQGTFDLDGRLRRCQQSYLARVGTMRRLSAARVTALATTVRETRAAGGVVKIFLTPLHPRAEPYVARRSSSR